MGATVASTFEPVSASAKRQGAAFAVDLARRLTGNLYHAYVRVTGRGDLPGFAAGHGVTGHGHTGAGDGLPMARQLGLFMASLRRDDDAFALGDGYSASSEPMVEVSLTGKPETWRHAVGGQFFSALDYRDGVLTTRIAPWLRGVRVSPGCHYVGAIVVYEAVVPRGSTGATFEPAGWIRLTSAPSALVSGDVDGSSGRTYEATRAGRMQALYLTGGELPVGSGVGLPRESPLAQVALGNVAMPTPSDRGGAQFANGANGIDRFAGACRVTGGTLNDIDIELSAGRGDAVLRIWGVTLFEIGISHDERLDGAL